MKKSPNLNTVNYFAHSEIIRQIDGSKSWKTRKTKYDVLDSHFWHCYLFLVYLVSGATLISVPCLFIMLWQVSQTTHLIKYREIKQKTISILTNLCGQGRVSKSKFGKDFSSGFPLILRRCSVPSCYCYCVVKSKLLNHEFKNFHGLFVSWLKRRSLAKSTDLHLRI